MIDATELELVRTSLRHVLDTHAANAAAVPAALLAEGWAELVGDDPGAAITTLAEEAGRARSNAPVADLAVLWALGRADDATTVVLHGDEAVALAGAGRATAFVHVTADHADERPASSVTLAPVNGFDPAFGLSRATFDHAAAPALTSARHEAALAAARRALASQMVGAVDQMLAVTIAYVVQREQYGRAIGSFQSVKHRLAEVKVAGTAARASVRAAWEHAESTGGPTLSMAAKALAGRAQQLASTHCFQVHGGIAFTVEHGFQQWVRRGLLLDRLHGGHEELTRQLGRHLITAGDVPRLPNLWT
jgi:alkylation response protein AidB-like acyl-CoA dehydrogenase